MSTDLELDGPDTEWLHPRDLRREVEAPVTGRRRKPPTPDSEADTIARIMGASLTVSGVILAVLVLALVVAAIGWR